jgi:hypothetical protein
MKYNKIIDRVIVIFKKIICYKKAGDAMNAEIKDVSAWKKFTIISTYLTGRK